MKKLGLFIVLSTLILNVMAQKKIVQTAGRTQLGSHARGRRFESDILHSQVSMTFDEVISSLIVPHPSLDKIFDILTQAKL